MDHFSIAELSRFSGVKPFIIRTWEKRYRALKPGRTLGNTRFYNGDQLRRLLNIVSLSGTGLKVSKLCKMRDQELFNLIEQQKTEPVENVEEFFISQLIAAGLSYDEYLFNNTFAHCQLRFGLYGSWVKILYPAVQRLGLLWNCDVINAGNEHFFTSLLNRKLHAATDLLPPPDPGSSKWALFLPVNELHETGLLFANYMVRHSRKKTIYLGADVPTDIVLSAAEKNKTDYLLLFQVSTSTMDKKKGKYLDELHRNFKGKSIYIATQQKNILRSPGKKILYLHSPADLEQALKNA